MYNNNYKKKGAKSLQKVTNNNTITKQNEKEREND